MVEKELDERGIANRTGRLKTQDLRRSADAGFTERTGYNSKGYPLGVTEATITAYACACPTPDAPTTPAIILDPFGGTGTVAGVAKTLGRYGISNDLSESYNRLAIWRITQSGHFTKTEQRAWADRQGSLL